MEYVQTFPQQPSRYFIKYLAVAAAIISLGLPGAAQAPPPKPELAWSQELNKYPGLFPELGQLLEKMQHDIQFPAPRTQSHLLPLLPETSVFYAAFPNYGDASHQALAIFQRELQQSPVLRAWWQHGEMTTEGPKLEDSMEKLYQLSQYLGDEIVVAGTSEGRQDPGVLILAEVRKPGLKDFLQQRAKELAGKSTPPIRVLDIHELAAATDKNTDKNSDKDKNKNKTVVPEQQLVILVRPDFVVAALNLDTLRTFNARLDQNSREFASTPFGLRLQQSYDRDGGTTILAAADLQKILSQIPHGTDQNQMIFQRTGFADMKYLVSERKFVAGHPEGQMELSFTGPRRRVASWLAAPGPVESLDFVSPKAVLAATLRLESPAQIFDDVKDLSNASNSPSSNSGVFASIPQMEAALKLNLKNDLLNLLGGELTLEVDSLTQPDPVWKAILQVTDPDHLQTTLNTLLTFAGVTAQQSSQNQSSQNKDKNQNEDGVIYHTIRIPSAHKATEISYAFVDGYLVIASSQQTVADAIELHRTGGSLAKSAKFLAALPSGNLSQISGLLYEDPLAIAALSLSRASPEMAEIAKSFSQKTAETSPVVICGYGEETALREVNRNGGMDAGILIGAAIAIPNLLRARTAANEASAVASMRVLNTAQIAYASVYPQRGYARDLASLGPDPRGSKAASADHADFIDATLGCTTDAWCTKSGYRFSITTTCDKDLCKQFATVGTPISSSTGTRNFCSISDAVIRVRSGPSLSTPVSVSECQAWTPLN